MLIILGFLFISLIFVLFVNTIYKVSETLEDDKDCSIDGTCRLV